MKNDFFLPIKVPRYLLLSVLLIAFVLSACEKNCSDTPTTDIYEQYTIIEYWDANNEKLIGLFGKNQVYPERIDVRKGDSTGAFKDFDKSLIIPTDIDLDSRMKLYLVNSDMLNKLITVRYYISFRFDEDVSSQRENDVDTVEVKYKISQYKECGKYYPSSQFDTLQASYNNVPFYDIKNKNQPKILKIIK